MKRTSIIEVDNTIYRSALPEKYMLSGNNIISHARDYEVRDNKGEHLGFFPDTPTYVIDFDMLVDVNVRRAARLLHSYRCIVIIALSTETPHAEADAYLRAHNLPADDIITYEDPVVYHVEGKFEAQKADYATKYVNAILVQMPDKGVENNIAIIAGELVTLREQRWVRCYAVKADLV